MKRWTEVLQWCGFTPTQREARLRRLLERAIARGVEQRAAVQRVERLVAFRESLGAGTIDVESVRRALAGTDR